MGNWQLSYTSKFYGSIEKCMIETILLHTYFFPFVCNFLTFQLFRINVLSYFGYSDFSFTLFSKQGLKLKLAWWWWVRVFRYGYNLCTQKERGKIVISMLISKIRYPIQKHVQYDDEYKTNFFLNWYTSSSIVMYIFEKHNLFKFKAHNFLNRVDITFHHWLFMYTILIYEVKNNKHSCFGQKRTILFIWHLLNIYANIFILCWY